MYGKKFLVLEDGSDKYDADSVWDVRVREVTDGLELAKLLVGELSYSHPAMDELLKNDAFREALRRQGWIDAAQIERIEKNAEPIKRFYILEREQGYRGYQIHQIDLENMQWYQADKLAPEDSQILQVISKSSLKKLNPKAYKEYLEAKKRLEALKKKNKKAAETRAANKKAKKLAEAKALLEKEGIPVAKKGRKREQRVSGRH